VIGYIEDQLLRFLQRRCKHPGHLVAVDILEGSGKGIEVKHCGRCGAVRTVWDVEENAGRPRSIYWRTPNPNLWRGK
jgi:hypothetical protein